MNEPIEQWRAEFEAMCGAMEMLDKLPSGDCAHGETNHLWHGFLMGKRAGQADAWRDMDTAPMNVPIILDIGMPWAGVGVWCAASDKWCYSDMQIDQYNGEFCDTYFQNEYETTPIAWQPLPEVRK